MPKKLGRFYFSFFCLIIAIVGCLIIYIEIKIERKEERKKKVLKNEALSPMDNEDDTDAEADADAKNANAGVIAKFEWGDNNGTRSKALT